MTNKIKELWENELSDKEIALKLGLLRRYVSKIRFDLKLAPNNKTKVLLELEDIKSLLETHSLTKIAIIKNCSVQTICNFVKTNNLTYSFNNGKNPKIIFCTSIY